MRLRSMSKSRPKFEVEKALAAKGFTCSTTNHNYFIFHTSEQKKTAIKTMTSFGHKPKDISGNLLSAMARQCQLTNSQFLELVDCPLSRDDYEALLQEQGVI